MIFQIFPSQKENDSPLYENYVILLLIHLSQVFTIHLDFCDNI